MGVGPWGAAGNFLSTRGSSHFGEEETLGPVLIEGAVSVHSHKGSKVTSVLLTEPRRGGVMSQGRAAFCLRSLASRK